MPVIFSETVIQLIAGFTVLTVLIGAAIAVLARLRPRPLQQERTAREQLEYFRELKSQGKLSQEEYRKIVEQLSAQIVEQGKNSSELKKEEPAVLLARQHWVDGVEDKDDTQVVGRAAEGDKEDTAVGW